MKKLKDILEEKRQKRASSAPAAAKTGSKFSSLRWLVAFTLIAVAGLGTYAVLHFIVLTRVPYAMLGTWVVMEVKTPAGAKADQALKGGRLEFRRDGTMIGTVNMDGKEGKIKAHVEVEERTLRITSVNPNNGEKVTDVQMIQILENDRFVIEDHKGTVLMMERQRE